MGPPDWRPLELDKWTQKFGEALRAWRFCFAIPILLAVSCDKKLLIGECGPAEHPVPDGGDADSGSVKPGVPMPWTSGFETGFCEFARAGGFCLQTGSASYALVTSPVHSGTFAAAFTVVSDENNPGYQSRCVRQGTFPQSAYYGAWFYVRSTTIETGIWDLFYFQGRNSGQNEHGLWNVLLAEDGNGQLQVSVVNLLNNSTPDLTSATPIPIETWFHLEFYYKRASDSTGEVALYQGDQEVLHLTALQTDDTQWGQWYVGSYATGLAPSPTTVFVDDVTIRESRQ